MNKSGINSERDRSPLIKMRKNSKHTSRTNLLTSEHLNSTEGIGTLVILETADKKMSFNIKNDKEFFDKNNINSNLSMAKNSIIALPYIKHNEVPKPNNPNITLPIYTKVDEEEQGIDINIDRKSQKNLSIKSGEVIYLKKTMNNENENEETIEIKEGYEKPIWKDEISPKIFTDREDPNVEKIKKINLNVSKPTPNRENKNSSRVVGVSRGAKEEKTPIRGSPAKILLVSNGRGQYLRQGSDIADDEDSKNFPFRICFICDQFYLKEKTQTADGCEHTFCQKCGKAFFEEKIEQGDIASKCPVYKCPKKIDIEIIKQLVSTKHFCVMEGKDPNEINTGNLFRLTNSQTELLKQNYNNYFNKIDAVKLYTQKHVIDINTNESFFIFNKAKEQFCVKCHEPALYGKSGKFIVKCLNCYHTICKFCMKSFTPDHFEITSFNYCKVYFRKRLKKAGGQVNQKSCKNFGLEILISIATFFLILLGTYKFISIFLSNALCLDLKTQSHTKAKVSFGDIIKIPFFYFFMVLFCTLVTPLIFMLIPYLPVILAALR